MFFSNFLLTPEHSLINIFSVISSKLEDDPLYTSYSSMMAKVQLGSHTSSQSVYLLTSWGKSNCHESKKAGAWS